MRAREKSHIRRSGSVKTETRRCCKRTGTRAVALSTEPDRGTTIQWVLRPWEVQVQALPVAAARQRRPIGLSAASMSTGSTIRSLILVAGEAGAPINWRGRRSRVCSTPIDSDVIVFGATHAVGKSLRSRQTEYLFYHDGWIKCPSAKYASLHRPEGHGHHSRFIISLCLPATTSLD